MRITIQSNDDEPTLHTNVESGDPRVLGTAVRAAMARLQQISQTPGTYRLTLEVTKADEERIERERVSA